MGHLIGRFIVYGDRIGLHASILDINLVKRHSLAIAAYFSARSKIGSEPIQSVSGGNGTFKHRVHALKRCKLVLFRDDQTCVLLRDSDVLPLHHRLRLALGLERRCPCPIAWTVRLRQVAP